MSKVFDLVLGVFREPGLVAELREKPLPDDLGLVIRLAAGEEAALQSAVDATGEVPETLLEASVFFLQQVLFAPGADSYRVLGASADWAQDRLRENYRWLMKWLHPDRNQDGWEAVYADRVNVAWQDLKTPDRRAEYDRRAPLAITPSPSVGTSLARRSAPAARAASGPLLSGSAVRRLPTLVLGSLGVIAAATVGVMYWAQSETARELTERRRDRGELDGGAAATPATPAAEPAVVAAAQTSVAAAADSAQADAVQAALPQSRSAPPLVASSDPAAAATPASPEALPIAAAPIDPEPEPAVEVASDAMATEPTAGPEATAAIRPTAAQLPVPEPAPAAAVAQPVAVANAAPAATPTATAPSPAEPTPVSIVAAPAPAPAPAQASAPPTASPEPTVPALAASAPAPADVGVRAGPAKAAAAPAQTPARAEVASSAAAPAKPAPVATSAGVVPASKSGPVDTSASVASRAPEPGSIAESPSLAKAAPRPVVAAPRTAEPPATSAPAAPAAPAVASAPAPPVVPAASLGVAPGQQPARSETPVRSDAEALVREFASAYAAGDLARFDRLLDGTMPRAPAVDSMRSRFVSTEMRYLEIQQLRWHPEAEQGHVRAKFRDTYVPKGGRKAVTESGDIEWTIRVDAGDARIAGVARNDVES